MNDPVNWQAIAIEYRRRLHTVCFLTAFALFAALGFGCAKVVEWMHVDAVTMETIAMFAWLPMGAIAWYCKGRLEDWADRGLPNL